LKGAILEPIRRKDDKTRDENGKEIIQRGAWKWEMKKAEKKNRKKNQEEKKPRAVIARGGKKRQVRLSRFLTSGEGRREKRRPRGATQNRKWAEEGRGRQRVQKRGSAELMHVTRGLDPGLCRR